MYLGFWTSLRHRGIFFLNPFFCFRHWCCLFLSQLRNGANTTVYMVVNYALKWTYSESFVIDTMRVNLFLSRGFRWRYISLTIAALLDLDHHLVVLWTVYAPEDKSLLLLRRNGVRPLFCSGTPDKLNNSPVNTHIYTGVYKSAGS